MISVTNPPEIGSEDFRRLPFGRQIELIAQCFFRDRINQESCAWDHSGYYDRVKINISYPTGMCEIPNSVALIDLVPNHYASYLAQFDDKFFYRVRREVLDHFGIFPHALTRKMWSFNFPLLSLDHSLYYMFKYVLGSYFLGAQEPAALFFAAKLFVFLEMCAKEGNATYERLIADIKRTYHYPKKGQQTKLKHILDRLVLEVQLQYDRFPVRSLYELNQMREGLCTDQHVDLMQAFHALQFLIFQTARFKRKRALFPLIPYEFYASKDTHHHFKVMMWELFDDKIIKSQSVNKLNGCTIG